MIAAPETAQSAHLPAPKPDPSVSRTAVRQVLTSVGQDFLIGGITLAGILLLVGTGTTWLRSLMGLADIIGHSQSAIAATLLLNTALVLFGWRRLRVARRSGSARPRRSPSH